MEIEKIVSYKLILTPEEVEVIREGLVMLTSGTVQKTTAEAAYLISKIDRVMEPPF